MVEACLLLIVGALVLWAAVTDWRTREIPDLVPLAVLALALIAASISTRSAWWSWPLGGLIALAGVLPLAWLGGVAGGDVKLFTALGFFFGFPSILWVAVWIAIAGLPFALLAKAQKKTTFAYGPAICLGTWFQIALLVW